MRVRDSQLPRWVAYSFFGALLLVAASCQPRPNSSTADVGARPPGAATMRPSAARAVRSRKAHNPVPPASALPLVLKLGVSRTTLTMAQRARFQIHFIAVNKGARTLDPLLHSVRLLVNGRPSVSWMLAMGNGPRDRRWYALPAGESLQMGWALGKALFPAPGRYTMVLGQGTLRSAAVTVTVAP